MIPSEEREPGEAQCGLRYPRGRVHTDRPEDAGQEVPAQDPPAGPAHGLAGQAVPGAALLGEQRARVGGQRDPGDARDGHDGGPGPGAGHRGDEQAGGHGGDRVAGIAEAAGTAQEVPGEEPDGERRRAARLAPDARRGPAPWPYRCTPRLSRGRHAG